MIHKIMDLVNSPIVRMGAGVQSLKTALFAEIHYIEVSLYIDEGEFILFRAIRNAPQASVCADDCRHL